MNQVIRIFFLLTLLASPSAHALGIYLVPGDGTSAPDSYSLPDGVLVYGPEGSKLTFSLPAELVGPGRMQFSLSPQAGPGLFTFFADDDMTASCTISTESATCLLKYGENYGGSIDPVIVENYLRTRFGSDPTELSRRLEKAKTFARDPEGVVIVPLAEAF
jgi:hypothetical protein